MQTSFIAQTQGDYIAQFAAVPPYRMNQCKRYEGHKVKVFPVTRVSCHACFLSCVFPVTRASCHACFLSRMFPVTRVSCLNFYKYVYLVIYYIIVWYYSMSVWRLLLSFYVIAFSQNFLVEAMMQSGTTRLPWENSRFYPRPQSYTHLYYVYIL